MTDIFSDFIKSGEAFRAEMFQNIMNFLKGSSVAGGSVSASGINIPSESARNPRIVRFVADEDIQSYSIIELTEAVEESGDNQTPTFKAKPATGDGKTLFYTAESATDADGAGLACRQAQGGFDCGRTCRSGGIGSRRSGRLQSGQKKGTVAELTCATCGATGYFVRKKCLVFGGEMGFGLRVRRLTCWIELTGGLR